MNAGGVPRQLMAVRRLEAPDQDGRVLFPNAASLPCFARVRTVRPLPTTLSMDSPRPSLCIETWPLLFADVPKSDDAAQGAYTRHP